MENQDSPRRFWIKEPFSSLSHFVGIGLSVAALIVLLVLAGNRPWHLVSFAIYGASLIVLYTASTLYHTLRVAPRHVDRLMRFDHIAIFLLIAGTYAPVCLISLRQSPWGWSLFGIEYGLAALGITASIFWKRAPDALRVALYIIMGWIAVAAMHPLRQALPPAAVHWLFAGGIVYSLGTIVFATDRPHLWPGKFSAHDLWHLFVLGGSVCHFMLMLQLAARTV